MNYCGLFVLYMLVVTVAFGNFSDMILGIFFSREKVAAAE